MDGETLNSPFEVFADWDDLLRHSDFPEMRFNDGGSQLNGMENSSPK